MNLQIFQTSESLCDYLKNNSDRGFVPTMGNLHEGHLSLIEEAARQHNTIVTSIFVNPTQFGPNEDFESYPRTLQMDIEKIQSLTQKYPKKFFLLFAPVNSEEIYPPDSELVISLPKISNKLCGENRPGHFDGVATVVFRLFQLVKPNKAYFGKKDFQQFLLIKKLVSETYLNIEVVGLPIKRDKQGLALSSRNQYLSQEQYKQGLRLPESLNSLAKIFKERGIKETQSFIDDLKKDSKWDYLEALDARDLSQVTPNTTSLLIAGALKLGETRLIDNIHLEKNTKGWSLV